MDNIDYYNENAASFFERTVHVDIAEYCKKFLEHIPSAGSILDAGCGSGRDCAYFKKKGYDVVAFDASLELVKLATQHTGLEVLHTTFQEMTFEQAFDGVWANASLLHVPFQELLQVFSNIHKALKPGGVFFGSFKYGNHVKRVESTGRVFYDMDEEGIKPYLQPLFSSLDIWVTEDLRSTVAKAPSGQWLSFLAVKT